MNSQAIRSNLIEAYDNYVRENESGDGNELRPWQAAQRDQFLALLQADQKQSLLDLGAGTGFDSRFFADHGFSVLAIDFSPEMVRISREQGIATLELDFFNLHQVEQQFDAVWAMNALIHVEKQNLSLILQQIRQILKPNGLFFLSVYGGYDFEGVFENDLFTPARYFSFYTDENLKTVLADHFEIIQFTSVESTSKYHPQCAIVRNSLQAGK